MVAEGDERRKWAENMKERERKMQKKTLPG
jgi:hypothetical protein